MVLNTESEVIRNTFRRGQMYNNGTVGIQCRTKLPSPLVLGPAILKYIKEVQKVSKLPIVTNGINLKLPQICKEFDLKCPQNCKEVN